VGRGTLFSPSPQLVSAASKVPGLEAKYEFMRHESETSAPTIAWQMQSARRSWFQRSLPALSLMVLSPLVAELLPGATRLSAIFVFPIEVLIWGGGTVLIREAVRRWRLGWLNLLLLALALAVAEECLIQQTSLAPVVIKLKGPCRLTPRKEGHSQQHEPVE
jgi:hypothetical protein